MESFSAFRIHNDGNGYRAGVECMRYDQLTLGDTLIAVEYSSVNYKDALAGTGKGKILRRFPLNGGIDCAGTVLESANSALQPGMRVLVTGSGLSETVDGGYSGAVRIDSQHVIVLPAHWSTRDAMILGTAGFTAGLALLRMLENRQHPALGPIAITGATGGVGMLACGLFARAGFEVHAVSGKPEYAERLLQLGASNVLPRESILSTKAMDSVRFGGAMDTVGGLTLASLLAQTAPYGNVASCGLVASEQLPSTVMPFIIRGVSLLGIASAGTERTLRERVWALLAEHGLPSQLNGLPVTDIDFDGLPAAFERLLAGAAFGRLVVKIAGKAC